MANSIEKAPELTTSGPEKFERFPLKYRIAMGICAVGLTLAATLSANRMANEKSNDVVTLPDATRTMPDGHSRIDEVGVGAYNVALGSYKFQVPGIRLGRTNTEPGQHATVPEHTSSEFHVELMKYAHLFDADPDSMEPRGQLAIDNSVDAIVEAVKNGSIDSVNIKGYSSDESDTRVGKNHDNPGLGIDDPKNIKLANKRANAVKSIVIEKLKSELSPTELAAVIDKINVEQGEEVQDSNDEKSIADMARHLHMSEADMVMAFNDDHGSVPKEARDVLEGLVNDRYVAVEIVSDVPAEHLTGAPIKQSKKLILIPLFLPMWKRRNKDGSAIPASGYGLGGSGFGTDARMSNTGGGLSVGKLNGATVVVEDSGRIEPLGMIQTVEPIVVTPEPKPERTGNPWPTDRRRRHSGVKEQPGYGTVAGHLVEPSTHNAGHSKGSGGAFAAKVHTSKRGNTARQHGF